MTMKRVSLGAAGSPERPNPGFLKPNGGNESNADIVHSLTPRKKAPETSKTLTEVLDFKPLIRLD
jgi:hypothetical protein